MPQYQTWEEFSRAAEKLYLADPMKARVVLKYRHSDGSLCIKVTDDLVNYSMSRRDQRYNQTHPPKHVWCIEQTKLKM
ncbi:signal recognition particle 9 kDa protein isoform X2 [Orcinus orca]|uniref:signal recognition particle 9 kDa protein isoform X2 n=1 Tax=Orcinus orca TaxID=9733 RepID=UPI000950CC1C|nr:signal recognition particle 9 kDa protein isoform X2 [Orcinus orca]